jgi:hypothetical protein
MPIEVDPISTDDETPEIVDTLEAATAQPKKVMVDGQSIENHSIPDLIAADKYLKSRTAASTGLGVRYVKFVPPGSV